MKYIKTFENSNLKYKKDDYVYVTGYPNFDNLSKINLVNSNTSTKRSWDYLIYAMDIETGKIAGGYIDESDIDRRLTPEEVEEYELKKVAHKYNL